MAAAVTPRNIVGGGSLAGLSAVIKVAEAGVSTNPTQPGVVR